MPGFLHALEDEVEDGVRILLGLLLPAHAVAGSPDEDIGVPSRLVACLVNGYGIVAGYRHEPLEGLLLELLGQCQLVPDDRVLRAWSYDIGGQGGLLCYGGKRRAEDCHYDKHYRASLRYN